MIKHYQIIEGKLIDNGAEKAAVSVYINPDEQERKLLVDNFQIDEHTLTSAMDPDELGRVEFEANHSAIIIKRPKRYSSEDNFLFKISSVGMFLFADRLIIVIADDTQLFDHKSFQKIRSLPDILLKVVHRCIIHFEQHLHVIQQISNELECEVNKAMQNRDLLHMFTLEKSLVYYLKAIGTNGKVIERLKANSAKFNYSAEEVEFLDDVIIENSQCHEEANTYSQVLSSMMDAWVSIVSNNLNILIKNLTLIMIGIMAPTLVISTFSMNVQLPIVQEGTHRSFWIIIFLAVMSIVIVVGIYKTRKRS